MAALFALGGGLTISAQPYSFSTVDVPAANVTYVDSINNFGQLAGYFVDAKGPHGFVATRQHFKTIDPPYGPLDNTYAGIAMNDFGVSVGKALVTDSSGQIIGGTGFLEANGKFMNINAPNAAVTQPLGINNFGQIIGFFIDSAGTHGFLETNGIYRTIQNPSATGASIPFSINNLGQIVGWFDEGSATHGFLYQNGVFTSIEDPIAPDATFATGINDWGQIVGFYIDAAGFHGFVETNGAFTTVDEPNANGGGTFPAAINDVREVAGEFGNHGFVAAPEDGVSIDISGLTGIAVNSGNLASTAAFSNFPSGMGNLLRLLKSGR